jgi:hypothetical protein
MKHLILVATIAAACIVFGLYLSWGHDINPPIEHRETAQEAHVRAWQWVQSNPSDYPRQIMGLSNATPSMGDLFGWRRGWIVLELSPIANMRHREIGVFEAYGQLVIHRYWQRGSGYIGDGDNNPRSDGFISNHVGRVVFVVTWGEANPIFAQ